LSYAYYKQNEVEQALNTVDRFIKLNPQHPSIDYAYYIKGLITFDSGKNLIHYVLPRDPSNNDPTSLHDAFKIFSHLVEEYPDSKYADDAKLRMIYLRNELAEYELKVAEFYMRRGAYVAAANRSKYILENYQGAEIMPEAIFMLEQAYVQLGIDDLAEDTYRVYAQNFQTGKDGKINEKFTRENRSCAKGKWSRALEKLRLRTYYCN
ncbi:MAG: outer membrane protein assembly factor BamD, partial [Gammaproteobacteria bacterium]|nr:outer membrane protein assembly factor BamD [Gammaproteobacteria bacterium]